MPGPGDLALTIALSPGQVVTYQFGSIEPFGASFKVTPETTETEVNVRKCFRINGTDRDLVAPQSVFPSLENFKVSSRHGPVALGMGQGQGTPHGYSLSDGTSLRGQSIFPWLGWGNTRLDVAMGDGGVASSLA